MGKRGKTSLRVYLSVLVWTSLVAMCLVLIYFTWSLARLERAHAEQSTLNLAELVANNVVQSLEDGEKVSATLAERPMIRKMDVNSRDSVLNDFLKFYPQFANLNVISTNGYVIHSALPNREQVYLGDLEYFEEVTNKGTFVVSEAFVGRITKKWVAVLARPIRNEEGGIVGVLSLPVDLGRYQSAFRGISFSAGGVITLIDQKGTILARSLQPEKYVGQNVLGSDLEWTVKNEVRGIRTLRGADGVKRIVSYLTIPKANWHVHAGVPTDTAFAMVQKVISSSLFIAIFTLICLSIVTGILTRKIRLPVEALSEAVTKATEGKLGHRLSVEGPAELSVLGEKFNQMLEVRAQSELALAKEAAELKRTRDELQSNRNLLQAILDHSSALICVKGLDRKYLLVNRQFEKVFGRLHSVIGLTDEAVFPSALAKRLKGYEDAAIEGRKVIEQVESIQHEGRTHYYLSLKFPLISASGEVYAICGHSTNITELIESEKNLREAKNDLEQLSHRLLHLQEKERKHLARELHDEVGQGLTALMLNLHEVERFRDDATLSKRLPDSIALVDRILQQVRTMSLELRPPLLDELGLVPALKWHVSRMKERANLRIDFEADEMLPRLNPDVEIACFRVSQEALTNIIRHAKATQADIRLRVAGETVHLLIKDNGIGFDTEKGRAQQVHSSGWIGMQERVKIVGGQFLSNSVPGEGTTIEAWFPVKDPTHEGKA
ncbi:MAG: cache domain-containing protein [Verrucomicrobiota bacterium]|nr:cache domain-containing protein [Verrucomicrobiota bacterium]